MHFVRQVVAVNSFPFRCHGVLAWFMVTVYQLSRTTGAWACFSPLPWIKSKHA